MNVLYALRRAQRFHGGRTAIHDGSRSLTYRQFYERVVRAGNALRGLGVKRGDRVAALLLNSPEYLELYFATALVGAAIVPINTRWSAADVAFTLEDSGSTVCALDDCFARMRHELGSRCAWLYTGGGACPDGMADYAALVAAASPCDAEETEPEEHEIAGLFYTSGTTGGSKGVMLTHRNLYANALHLVIEAKMSAEWIWLHAGPMFHLADLAGVFALVLVGGGHCFIPAFDAEAFLRAVEQHRANSTLLVPTMINLIVNHPAVDRYDKSSLRFVLYGASPMPLDLLRRAVEKLGCGFMQGYGLTEASPLLTILSPEDHDLDGAAVRSVGRPTVGVEVRVVDAQDREVAPGEPGEVVARGANVMKGYWRRPEISADTLRGGWLHTGDIGTFDENGYLYILDRKKDMIKTGGENVYSPEVESAICGHPDVLEVAVIGLPDEKWGEVIKAVVVKRPGRSLTEPELLEYCRARMTHFKCPSSVDFVESLPKGGTGKLQKNVLRKRYVS